MESGIAGVYEWDADCSFDLEPSTHIYISNGKKMTVGWAGHPPYPLVRAKDQGERENNAKVPLAELFITWWFKLTLPPGIDDVPLPPPITGAG
jgi:hypothetical protein